MERLSYTMRDEINDLANKIDNQSLEVKDVQGALRVQNKMFEAQNAKLVGSFSNLTKRYFIHLCRNFELKVVSLMKRSP